jgi:predicted phosphodiesterase
LGPGRGRPNAQGKWMKLAILTDIHANLEALEAVLIAAAQAGAERIVSLGDVVGYGADPLGCVYRLQEVGALAILGNHDQAVLEPSQIHGLNSGARSSLLHARDSLDAEALGFLKGAAYRRVEFGGVMAHAHPSRPEDWDVLVTHDSVELCMAEMDWSLGFYGHTHHAAIYCQMRERVLPLTSATVAIGSHRYLINPGSVGQPRDGDWRAAFALWDVDRQLVELRRVEYAVASAQSKIIEAGFPAYQAERLASGE